MAQIFHRSFNTVSKVSIFGAAFFLAAAGAALAVFVRSDFMTGANIIRDQPVPFSHQQHVFGLGIDCRYCHTSVETSAYAGMPPTKTCMNCHEQIWVGTELLEPVRSSFRTDISIEWNRVHRLADFVYFNHAVHVNKGVGCVECHGRIDRMQLVRQHGTLLMEWCLDCHRNPAPRLRPRDQVFNMEWSPADAKPGEDGVSLAHKYDVQSLLHCSACHR